MTEQTTSKSWHKKWWGIILTILFFPLFIPYLIWAKTTWKIWVKVVITAFCATIVISSIVSNQDVQPQVQHEQNETIVNNENQKDTQPKEKQADITTDKQNTGTKSDTELKNELSSKYINGLSPVDVYLNMEKQGFKTKTQFSSEYGNFWTSTKNYAGIDYTVETYSSNIKFVESVQATALVDLSQKRIIAAQQFFIFVSSLPYDNANPQKAGQWIVDNYDNDKATTTIGDAKFTIYAPSIALRMIRIEKAK